MIFLSISIFIGLFIAGGAIALFAYALTRRRVVPANEVHVVQAGKVTVPYGKETRNGNAYYAWPEWVPIFGVQWKSLPVSIFMVGLDRYEAYDKDRVPFLVDVRGFFRIKDYNRAAERNASGEELRDQIETILQGAVRAIMATSDINAIMQGRGEYTDKFKEQVEFQLEEWGVEAVRHIELMDIRDPEGSKVIHNIMEKKKSSIEMESRKEVAENRKEAEVAEIKAKQEADMEKQEALQALGQRTAVQESAVGLANETTKQTIQEQSAITKKREMEVLRVQEETHAAIIKNVGITKAEQDKQAVILAAEANLETKRREAEGITVEGRAKADAKTAMELAPVTAQVTLAKEIGANDSYQQYLITIRRVEAEERIGLEQARALHDANIKIIANADTPTKGLSSVRDLFTASSGTAIGAMMEGLAQTPVGEKLVDRLTGNGPTQQ